MIRALEHLSYGKRLRNLCLFSLEKTERGLLSGAQRQDKGQWAQAGTQEISSNMRKNFLTLRVTDHWIRLPREVVESPSLGIFETCLDMILCNLL
ncbi:hypothetical protein llap_10328 [Limosa lapponica baueri]|uniref:Rna-directed dna polymerase from mobile element jockey-like n=1 Tax=Limosa lapponica baueri TaxID=1758121 RepID=A0A2I0TZX5_LIMLA|nr:hypothetical protein llap_10328 [Limosa lapponica baueri]